MKSALKAISNLELRHFAFHFPPKAKLNAAFCLVTRVKKRKE